MSFEVVLLITLAGGFLCVVVSTLIGALVEWVIGMDDGEVDD